MNFYIKIHVSQMGFLPENYKKGTKQKALIDIILTFDQLLNIIK